MDSVSFDVSPLRHVAYFVSAHGFGHATRACAVMAAVHALDSSICVDVFSAAPAWVFDDSLAGPFAYHHAITDVGLVQRSALVEDAPATLARLDELLPFDSFLLRSWADWLARRQCERVVCDTAPLGLPVAKVADLPSLLIENFTSDWIYQGYVSEAPGLERHADYLAGIFAKARYLLQGKRVCVPAQRADERLRPNGRQPRATAAATRPALGLEEGERLVLVTLGGVPDQPPLPVGTAPDPGVAYGLAGAAQTLRRDGPWLFLPHHSPVYYPHLLAGSDAVIAKQGYSTLAEAYYPGLAFGYLRRAQFPESPIVSAFVQRQTPY